MKKIDLLNLKGEKVNELKLNEEIFSITPNDKVLYDAIILARASLRQGTHSTKNRSEVSGGGRKPWRQKGTGHARQGSIRAVQWVGGGRYGTPVPRDYSKKQNRKERRLALKSALSHKFNDNEVIVMEELTFRAPKTKEMMTLLNTLKVADKKVLFVVDDFTENVILASRNIPNVALIAANELNVLDLVNSDVVVFTSEAIKKIEEALK
ncbi:MAG TPA: 50S ribosomal protein L4 [Candidatus Onthousia excrementipullorum]|uniref:Large ribosomal subunit protein uL4 n=1 Tax=Candidatus Onthousia excrementipullorum TaxID=2840884 RepID=A0A9D1J3E1_9FIRM|nr:50S ribosomal protein L4 [Candidatus Onthousia excrementipullorum]